jgi:dihydrodipicolinate synthase/N-acetylneuraminate lyase
MPALITPFDADGELDIEAHVHNVVHMADTGANGILVGGSTGAGPYLEQGERQALVASARDAVGDLTVICGVNAESQRQALAQTAEAADAGADAVLVITPTTLVRDRDDAVEAFYLAVADRVDLPVLLYTVPRVTGWELPVASVRRLAAHPSIVGMKDSGGDASRIKALGDVIDDGFVVYAGASGAITASAVAGAWGAITASANYALGDVALAVEGDRTAQHRLLSLTAAVERHGVAGTAHAAGLVGLTPGHVRKPLREVDADAASEIRGALAAQGLVSSQ